MTFEEAYYARKGHEVTFQRAFFRRCVPAHLRPVMVLWRVLRPSVFARDNDFIAAVGEAQSVSQVRRDIAHYLNLPENQQWLRRVLKLRFSGKRVIRFAQHYLRERSTTTDLAAEATTPSR